MDLWWTKPAGRRPLLKSVGRRSAPAGTAPAVMSCSSIPVKPRAKIKASALACASFQGSYWKELVRGPGGDVRSQKNRIAGKFPATIEGLAANWQSQKKNRNDKCPPGWQHTNSQDTPARWRPFGPAYPQDEPGRGICDGGILPEQILSAARNLNSGWNTNQNVPFQKCSIHFGLQRLFSRPRLRFSPSPDRRSNENRKMDYRHGVGAPSFHWECRAGTGAREGQRQGSQQAQR